jgi:hypothetical protein
MILWHEFPYSDRRSNTLISESQWSDVNRHFNTYTLSLLWEANCSRPFGNLQVICPMHLVYRCYCRENKSHRDISIRPGQFSIRVRT